jgi:DNA-binding transcriptional regulator YiaG
MNIVHVYIKAMKNWTPKEIKEFRKRLGLYQKDFAQMIGVTTRYVIYLEQGVRQPGKTLKILLSMIEGNENEKIKRKGGDIHAEKKVS